jgi:hypothetical protein
MAAPKESPKLLPPLFLFADSPTQSSCLRRPLFCNIRGKIQKMRKPNQDPMPEKKRQAFQLSYYHSQERAEPNQMEMGQQKGHASAIVLYLAYQPGKKHPHPVLSRPLQDRRVQRSLGAVHPNVLVVGVARNNVLRALDERLDVVIRAAIPDLLVDDVRVRVRPIQLPIQAKQ